MLGRFDEVTSRAVARWIAAVERRPGRVALLVLAVTVACGVYAARNLGVNADPQAMIATDVPFRLRYEALVDSFQMYDEGIFVVVDAESPVTAARAVDALAERLAEDDELSAEVVVPGGGEFFERNVLLYLDVEQLDDLADRLARVQPFLAEIARDPSAVGIANLLGEALEAARQGTDVGLDLASALDRTSAAVEAALAGRPTADPWSDALIGASLPEDARQRFIALNPRLDFGELAYAEPALRAIRKAARELGLDAERGVRVRITGNPILNLEDQSSLAAQGPLAGAISLVLFGVAALWAVRSIRTVLAMVASLVVALVWTNAFAAAAVGHLNQISVAFNVLLVGLGGEFGIHLCTCYAELVAAGRARLEALVETGETIGGSLLSSAGTTAIGFFVFLPTDYTGVAELGLIAGTGIFVSLFCTLTVLPALLCLGAPAYSRVAPAPLPAWRERLEHVPVRHARTICAATLLLALAAVPLLQRASFDYNPVNLRDPSTESVQAFNDLLARSHNSPWTLDVVAADLAEARERARRLALLPTVERAITLEDWVPDDQDEKLVLLEETSLFLPPLRAEGPPPDAAAQRGALARLAAELEPVSESQGSDALAQSARRLREVLRRFLADAQVEGSDARLALLASNVVGSLPEQLADLERALAAGPIGLEDLPHSLVEQMLAADGRARIQVFPREDLSDAAALERFMDEVAAAEPQATGSAAHLVGWGRVTVSALQQALASAVVIGSLFLLVLWRRAWDTFLAFLPLALAAAFTCAVMVVIDMPFNFANVIVLPMLLGMGIDSGIHLVHRHRTKPEEVDVLATSTARAVFFSAVTTMLSFASLAFVPHRGMAAVGKLLTLGVSLTLVCYVVVLPAVLEWDDRRRARSGQPDGPAPPARGDSEPR